jgi:hypothetical protein
MMAEIRLSGPIYVITQREAIEHEGELPILMDGGLLLTADEEVDESLLLVFTSRKHAEEWLAVNKNIMYACATFRKVGDLIACLQRQKCESASLNSIPGVEHENIIEINELIAVLRGRR